MVIKFYVLLAKVTTSKTPNKQETTKIFYKIVSLEDTSCS